VKLVRRSHRNESGFTLVDVVASFVILGIIMVPLSRAMFETMKIPAQNGGITKGATDFDRLQSVVSRDVAQAQQLWISPPPSFTPPSTWTANFPSLVFAYKPWDESWTTADKTPQSTPCTTGLASAASFALIQTYSWDPNLANFTYTGGWNLLGALEGKPTGPYKVGASTWMSHSLKARFTPMTAPVGYLRVEIYRSSAAWDWAQDPATSLDAIDEAPIATGYCKSGDVVSIAQATKPTGGAINESLKLTLSLRSAPGPSVPIVSTTIEAVERPADG
jgi:hypothetical protein